MTMTASRERGARLAGMLGGVGFGMSRAVGGLASGSVGLSGVGAAVRRGGGDRGVRGEVEGWVRA